MNLLQSHLLLPRPRQVEPREGVFLPGGAVTGWLLGPIERLPRAARGEEPLPEGIDGGNLEAGAVGYRVEIAGSGVTIRAAADEDCFRGLTLLRQLARLAKETEGNALPQAAIRDSPDFARRGFMLDVSRDRVPRMEFLYHLVDQLAELRYNELQLYIEHTFAYSRHRGVWKHADPFTAGEIRALDRYCAERFIELVPNQNSFGHMEHWLRHDPYNALAELPEKARERFAGSRSLCPTDPGSLELVAELYAELLPNFTSGQFNAGLDETFDLGKGRSGPACEERGAGRVYLDYLLEIHQRVRSHGRRMQFWADIILNHPELIAELPADGITPLIWGYEADHPFEEQCARLAEAGRPYYVCPGTATWLSLTGRTETMLANVRAAARAGRRHGATGLLMTEWGDNGHWQHPPLMLPGLAWGAAQAWCGEAAESIDLAGALDAHLLEEADRPLGEALLALGRAPDATGVKIPNATLFGRLLAEPERPLGDTRIGSPTAEGLAAGAAAIEAAITQVENANRREGDPWAAQAVLHNARMALHAARQGLARLQAGGTRIADIAQPARLALAEELGHLTAEHRKLWRVASRDGGLADSAGRLERLAGLYRDSYTG